MLIMCIVVLPLLMAVLSLCLRKSRLLGIINTCFYLLILFYALRIGLNCVHTASPLTWGRIMYVDCLGAFFLFTLSLITFAAALYSTGYIARDVREGVISEKKAASYYLLFNLFAFSMFLATVVDNLGLLWVMIEMTTLISAFLVGYYNTKRSVEAAWKYLIICSVGITLALLGTILFYHTAAQEGGIRSLRWTAMMSVAERLDPRMVTAAFLLILVGYGTKAGLAPMHTWLPDAHSQALAPISALLSGVLLKTALYAILRFTTILNKCVAIQYSSRLFVLFGFLSFGIAAGFILVQRDIKRLLAYSSIEHLGIIFLGLGFGGYMGVCGALFHMFNHAATKTLLFMGAGDIVKRYRTSDMNLIRGTLAAMPFTSVILILGGFAIAASPPFSIFFSEMMILLAGFKTGYHLPVVLFLVFAAIVFGAIVHHFSGVIFGRKPDDIASGAEPLSSRITFLLLLAVISAAGFKVPWFFANLLSAAGAIVRGIQ